MRYSCRLFVALFIVMVHATCCFADQKISADSLLSMIKEKGNVFSVMESLDVKNIDYDDVQRNDSLRSVLINLLDVRQYENYRYLSYHKPLHEKTFEN